MKINKRYFSKAICIIVFTLVAVVGINLFCNHLLEEGLSSLFTTRLKDAFENTPEDVFLINANRIFLSIVTIISGIFSLKYNAEMMEAEKSYREEMRLCGYSL